jgi:glycosyltransferase involved in cell wall biosynthesis
VIKKNLYFDATPLISKRISGVGKVLLETLRALDTDEYVNKYDIYLIVPFDEIKKVPIEGFRYIKVKSLPIPHKFLSLFSRLRISPPLDIFLGKGVYVFMNFRNWNLLNSKSITYIHDIAFRIYPEFIQQDNLKYLEKYIKLWLSRTDKVVAVSESTKQELVKEFNIKDVEVVINAIDDSMRPQKQSNIDTVLKKWSIPRSYYVHLSNVEPRKNLENLINAFTEYVTHNRTNDALVLIGGDGWSNEAIFEAINKAKEQGVTIIRPNDYVTDEDIPAIISGATALLQVSWHEGFGLSLLGAFACGTPAVISNIPSLKEVARGNEDRIVVVDPANIHDIARGIAEVKSFKHTAKPVNITRWRDSVKRLVEIIESLK